MWQNPMCAIASAGGDLQAIDQAKFQEDFDEFYDEIFEEFNAFGKLEDVQVCENLGDHMVGNVYVKYNDEEFAELALQKLNGRFYAGRMLTCEYSPVTDFREARCRQYDEGTCSRGPYCNFMHVREPSAVLRKHLQKEYDFHGGKMKGVGGMNTIRAASGGGGRGDFRDRERRDDRDRPRRRDSRDRDRERDYRDRDNRRDHDREKERGYRDSRDRDRNRDSRDRSDRGHRGRDDRSESFPEYIPSGQP